MPFNTSIDLTPIQRFMEKTAKMAALKQSEMRLSLLEVTEISATLALMLSQPVAISTSPSKVVVSTAPKNIDGGIL